MDYLTEERRLLKQSARDFAMNEVLSIANKLDPERGEIPFSIRNKLAELGYFGIMIPEE
jgi:alkylation response protein AidB-like acyl-CoA dehydrogenase